MKGGLHIEMALWFVWGDLLEASCWTAALADAGESSLGTAESHLKVSHLAKTQLVHQITSAALYKLLCEAFEQLDGKANDFDNRQAEMANSSPTLKFWYMILELEIAILLHLLEHIAKTTTLSMWRWSRRLHRGFSPSTTSITQGGYQFIKEI